MSIIDPHCAGCGAITSIPPLCRVCFRTTGARSPIVESGRKGFDYAIRIEGCVQHLTRDGLAEFVANTRWLEG